MSIEGFYLLPHPPIIIPEVGKGEEEKIVSTTRGFLAIGKEIAEKSPDTIILVTPHGTMFEDAISLVGENEISGSLKSFGASQVSMKLPVNKALTERINQLASENDISSIVLTHDFLKKHNIDLSLDHGAMVPLYFVNKYYSKYKLVHITYAPFSDIDLYRFGIIINEAVEELNDKAVFIASGDLSHKLKNEGPYGFSPYGEKFDTEFLQYLKDGDVEGVLRIDNKTIKNAGECGRRSVSILLGALEGKKFSGDILNYEGTFGVGYGVMRFNILSVDTPKLEKLIESRRTDFRNRTHHTDPYAKLARESLTTYLESGTLIKNTPQYVTDEMKSAKRGVFVSLKKNGELRGCIGTIFPTTGSLSEEIIRNAVEAGLNDPRFNEVRKEELIDVVFSVDVLTEPEPAYKEELDPKIYGVIVKSEDRTGLLLPDLEGVDSVDEQLSIALRKAGIKPGEEYNILKFKVIRHKENSEED